MLTDKTPRVVLLSRYVPHYRLKFHELLRQELSDAGVHYELVCSEPVIDHQPEGGHAEVPWARSVFAKAIPIAGRELLFQNVLGVGTRWDLVILEQQTKSLATWYYVALRKFGGPKIAMVGHGRNLSGSEDSIAERLKRRLTRQADWFLAYTAGTKEILAEIGYPTDQVTVFNNSLDNRQRSGELQSLGADELEERRKELGLSGPTVAFIGRMYENKRPDFLAEAIQALRQKIANVEVLVIGDDRPISNDPVFEAPWIHLLGPRYGKDLVVDVSLSELLLIPAAVGLVAVDSFALGTPIVTVDGADHGPEVVYLESGTDSLILASDTTPKEYGAAVAELLTDSERLAIMQRNCARRALDFTIEDMASRYADGVIKAIGRPKASLPGARGLRHLIQRQPDRASEK